MPDGDGLLRHGLFGDRGACVEIIICGCDCHIGPQQQIVACGDHASCLPRPKAAIRADMRAMPQPDIASIRKGGGGADRASVAGVQQPALGHMGVVVVVNDPKQMQPCAGIKDRDNCSEPPLTPV